MDEVWARGLSISQVQTLLREAAREKTRLLIDEVIDEMVVKVATRTLQQELKEFRKLKEEEEKKRQEVSEIARMEGIMSLTTQRQTLYLVLIDQIVSKIQR